MQCLRAATQSKPPAAPMHEIGSRKVNMPARFGFRSGAKGVHNTRTIMLEDLQLLLRELPRDATRDDYRKAIVEDNILAKRTSSTRKYTAQRLVELYALDPKVTLFRTFRFYWDEDDGRGHPLLAMLLALARDPILRTTANPVLELKNGEPFDKKSIEDAVFATEPDRFSATSIAKIARMSASSWTQAGHLSGRYNKIRSQPVTTPASAGYAFLLGYLGGSRGKQVFDTFWTRVLDVAADELHELAKEASRRGLFTYRNAGGIVDVAFDSVLRADELIAD